MVPESLAFVNICAGLLQSCVTALVLIGKATAYENKAKDAQCRTDLLLHDLATWAYAAGLTDDPPVLRVHVADAPRIPAILQQLESLLDHLTELKQYDNLLLDRDNYNTSPVEEDNLIVTEVGAARSKWERFDIRPFLSRLKPFRRLKWVLYDDEKFKDMLSSARGYVDSLEKYLSQARQESLGSMREFHLFQFIINADVRQSGIIGETDRHAVSAAAKLRRLRLTSACNNDPVRWLTVTPDDGSSRIKSMRLSKRQLKLLPDHVYTCQRSLESYNNNLVLLEWKYVEDLNVPGINKRVDQVAALLHEVGVSLNSLQCQGFVVDHRYKRYGYVFDLPGNVISSSGIQLESLLSMFKRPAPSLNAKVTLAITLLETILGVHTAGWLHKEIRSENIIMLRRGDNSVDDDDISSWLPFVTGFVCSRLDRPGEMTEPLSSEYAADLYRHPALLTDAYRPYRKAFDLFSVGCTLLEIGFWKPLHKILALYASPKETVGGSRRPAKERPRCHDLTALKQELLCSYTPCEDLNQSAANPATNQLLRSLQSAAGKKYTAIVREFLANCNAPETNENESILELEMKARNAARSIAASI